jgi:hypothetical protein
MIAVCGDGHVQGAQADGAGAIGGQAACVSLQFFLLPVRGAHPSLDGPQNRNKKDGKENYKSEHCVVHALDEHRVNNSATGRCGTIDIEAACQLESIA